VLAPILFGGLLRRVEVGGQLAAVLLGGGELGRHVLGHPARLAAHRLELGGVPLGLLLGGAARGLELVGRVLLRRVELGRRTLVRRVELACRVLLRRVEIGGRLLRLLVGRLLRRLGLGGELRLRRLGRGRLRLRLVGQLAPLVLELRPLPLGARCPAARRLELGAHQLHLVLPLAPAARQLLVPAPRARRDPALAIAR
jgi:hypothetical protein